jgi:peroxidase
MQFGQFIDHDVTLSAITRTENGSAISCCEQGNRRPSFRHPLCMPIDIPSDDPFFGSRGQRCMSFVRSGAATRLNCQLGSREQMNQLTAVIDASMIYGSSSTVQRSLRSLQGGQLLTSSGGSRATGALLPPQATGACNVAGPQSFRQCFRAGDIRVNENVQLTVLQTVFLRLHNSIATRLARINPNWPDDALFEETRRIVGALLQHFTYNEFLPPILGHKIMTRFGLLPLRRGYFSGYDPNVNPAIFSAFSTAAFRFHSMVTFAFASHRFTFSDVSLPDLCFQCFGAGAR